MSVTVRTLGVFGRWILCEVLHWFCLYQVHFQHKKGSSSERLCMVLWVFLISWLKLSPRVFFINIETYTRNLKVDIMLMPKDPVNTWMLEQIQLKYKWKLNAGILLHHNFMSWKGFSWITSGPLPQKERNIYRVHVSFSEWSWHIFFSKKLNNAHSGSWQVFLRKIVDYIVKKLTSAQSFLFLLFNSTPLHGVKL